MHTIIGPLLLAVGWLAAPAPAAPSGSAWDHQAAAREQPLHSPATNWRHLNSRVFNGRYDGFNQQQQLATGGAQSDWFECVQPSPARFEQFARQFNRTFRDGAADRLDRQEIFMTSLRRTILLNRIIQNEIVNSSNYDWKPAIGDYYFISPAGAQNVDLWYADITDCELGLIKRIVFDMFYFIDNNQYEYAYKLARENSHHLPLFDEDGFEQLANILLVRLYDRLQGEQKMNQLFQWPLYVKKLAAYAYNRQQAAQANFNAKLALVSFAYPSYFKDLKYNPQAINRTGDNWKAHAEHEKFNKQLGRRFASRQERNKRLAIFRQHWTKLNLLNEDREWKDITIEPDWLRHQYQPDLLSQAAPPTPQSQQVSEKLKSPPNGGGGDEWDNYELGGGGPGGAGGKAGLFRQTRFSDLTDAEFVAFLTNDFSLLDDSREAADYLDNNFPIEKLDEAYRDELATELELRNSIQLVKVMQQSEQQQSEQQLPQSLVPQRRAGFSLARQVVDELIGDVGLPIGSAALTDIDEAEHFRMFDKLVGAFKKNYGADVARAPAASSQLSDSDLADERQRRYETFKQNYGRFRAWLAKEGWQADESKLIGLLRLADMSWHDIKLNLFKLCCLTDDNLASLAASNSSIRYLGSHGFMCQPLHEHGDTESPATVAAAAAGRNSDDGQAAAAAARELTALELYYYYSVHFNKHHNEPSRFNQRFAIFRHNIDQIRRHSCIRGLTLYGSLRGKKSASLNSIDVLDPKRSHTDDINLDRFRYFSVPDLGAPAEQLLRDPEIGFERPPGGQSGEPDYIVAGGSGSGSDRTRAGFSYAHHRSMLNSLNTLQQQQRQPAPSGPAYTERLMGASQDSIRAAHKYRQLAVDRVYELVMQRYSECMKSVHQVDIDPRDLRQQCRSAGPLADKATSAYLHNYDAELAAAAGGRLFQRQDDKCDLYRQGLQPWSEGLIPQDRRVLLDILEAKCNHQ